MAPRPDRRVLLLSPLCWVFGGNTLGASSARASTHSVLVPIVSLDNPQRDISQGTLERVFLGHPVDGANGKRLVPFNHAPKTRPRVHFDRSVLGMEPEEVARYWVDQRIRGRGRPPRTIPKTSLLKQVVRRFPGAISYIYAVDLDDTVKALTVGGLAHHSPKYPLG